MKQTSLFDPEPAQPVPATRHQEATPSNEPVPVTVEPVSAPMASPDPTFAGLEWYLSRGYGYEH